MPEEGGQPEGTAAAAEPEGTGIQEPTFDIDGEKYTAQQIKEFKEGNLRQADYTRKTQELAEQQQRLKQITDWYDSDPKGFIESAATQKGLRVKIEAAEEALEGAEAEGDSKKVASLEKKLAGLERNLGVISQREQQRSMAEQGQQIEQYLAYSIGNDKVAKELSDGAKNLVRDKVVNQLWAIGQRGQNITQQDISKATEASAKEVRGLLEADRKAYIDAKTQDRGQAVMPAGSGATSTGKTGDEETPQDFNDPNFLGKLDSFFQSRNRGE